MQIAVVVGHTKRLVVVVSAAGGRVVGSIPAERLFFFGALGDRKTRSVVLLLRSIVEKRAEVSRGVSWCGI